MRQPLLQTTWKITCQSPEEAVSLKQWLASRIAPDRVLTDTVRVMPKGEEGVETVRHRLGDYFAEIRLIPDSQGNPVTFRLVFQRAPDSGRFWKDLMVNILQEIEASAQKPAIELESKGDGETLAPAAAPSRKS